jgi:hypothetical protein
MVKKQGILRYCLEKNRQKLYDLQKEHGWMMHVYLGNLCFSMNLLINTIGSTIHIKKSRQLGSNQPLNEKLLVGNLLFYFSDEL